MIMFRYVLFISMYKNEHICIIGHKIHKIGYNIKEMKRH
jgi:hypothetical protein